MSFWTMALTTNSDETIVYVKRTQEELAEVLREYLEDYVDDMPADISFSDASKALVDDYDFIIVLDEWDLADLGL